MHTEVFIDRHQNVWMPTNQNVTLLVGTILLTPIGTAFLAHTPRKS